jgi:hypothetical protein
MMMVLDNTSSAWLADRVHTAVIKLKLHFNNTDLSSLYHDGSKSSST